jgi:hypothetical protein
VLIPFYWDLLPELSPFSMQATTQCMVWYLEKIPTVIPVSGFIGRGLSSAY